MDIKDGDKMLKHIPYKKLEGFKKENNITNSDIANTLNISEAAVIKKNSGESDYYLSEIKKLEKELKIPHHIFLS
jgi:putative heme degradation protein